MAAKHSKVPRREQAEPHPGGWVELVATTDIGGNCELEIRRTLNADLGWFDPDPRVNINFKRHKSGLHPADAEPEWAKEWIEDIRASDLDSLVKAIQQAIAVARFHGIIPGPLSDDARREMLGAALQAGTTPAQPDDSDDDSDGGEEWKAGV